MVNNKAQAGMYAMAFMLAIVVIILGLAWAFPINEATSNARTDMNCSTTTDDFVSAGCLVTDIGQGYFIISILAIAGTVIAVRVIFQ